MSDHFKTLRSKRVRTENGTQYTDYQINNSIKNQIYQKIGSQNVSLGSLYDTMLSISPRLMSLILYDMINKHKAKTLNISRRSVSLQIRIRTGLELN